MAAAWRASARSGNRLPWALELCLLCDRFSSLPRQGGILDQNGTELNLMLVAEMAYRLSKTPMKHYTAAQRKLRLEIAQELRDAPL